MWNRWIKRILLLCFATYFTYQFVNLWIREDGNLLEWLFFSHRSYLKNLKEESHIMTGEEIADFLSNPTQQPSQKTKNELRKKMRTNQDLYVLIRITHKNERVYPASGKISYQVNSGDQIPIQIRIGGWALSNQIWIRPINPHIVLSMKSPDVPEIKISWLQIYHK